MQTETKPRLSIGDTLPEYYGLELRPIVRLDTWNNSGAWLALEKFDGSEIYIASSEDDTCRIYPTWSAEPEYWLPHNRAGYRPPVRVKATGRKPVRRDGEYWLRGRVEFCHDGEPSQFAPCWILLD